MHFNLAQLCRWYRISTNFSTKILPIIDIDEADAPGLKLENITPADKILIVHGTVPDRNQRKCKGESFDLIRIKDQINIILLKK